MASEPYLDLLSGQTPTQFSMRLSETPYILPFTLDDFVECTFEGYAPASPLIQNQVPCGGGYIWFSCLCQYLNLSGVVRNLAFAYLTCTTQQGEVLLCPITLSPGEFSQLPLGSWLMNFQINAFASPIG